MMGGRLHEETLDRFRRYGSRILDVVDTLERDHRPRRVIDQLCGSGTSAGANAHEAHEGLSKLDFVKCLGITAKELSETRYWLLLIADKKWLPPQRLEPLLQETVELLSIVKTIIARVRRPRP